MPPTSTAGSAEPAGAGVVLPEPARAGFVLPEPAGAGFVLLEIVPALVVLGLALLLVLPAVPRGTGAPGLLAVAVDAAALLRATRSAAIAAGAERAVTVDRRARRLAGETGGVAVPGDVDLAVLAGESCPAGAAGVAILFRADGTSCGGVIRLAKGARVLRLTINWATGHVAIRQGG